MHVSPKAMVVRRPRAGSLWSGLLAGINPVAFVRAFWRRREVLSTFARIEFASRYHGAQLGVLWSLVSPLATLTVYTFVFSVVFKPSWAGGGDGGVAGYALILFAGLSAFEVFAASLNRAPRILSENVNFIKKVLFPLEILPVGVILAAVLESLVSLALVALGVLVTTGRLPATAFFAPLAYLPLTMLTLGMCWLLAPVGVFLKDLGNIVGVGVQLLFFGNQFQCSRQFNRIGVIGFDRYVVLTTVLHVRTESTDGYLDWFAIGGLPERAWHFEQLKRIGQSEGVHTLSGFQAGKFWFLDIFLGAQLYERSEPAITNGDGFACGNNFHPAAQTVGGIHGNRAHGVFANIVLTFKYNDITFFICHLKGIVNIGKFDIFIKDHVDYGTNDLRDFSVILCLHDMA